MFLWECPGCGKTRICDALAGDDWPDGILRPVGPDCAECDERMVCVEDLSAPKED